MHATNPVCMHAAAWAIVCVDGEKKPMPLNCKGGNSERTVRTYQPEIEDQRKGECVPLCQGSNYRSEGGL